MATPNYHVIEFMYPPFEDRGSICIPASWVQWEHTDHIVVAFPDEEPSVTDERVRNDEPYSPSWSMYRARIIHSADTYDGATDYVNNRNIENPTEGSNQLDDITSQLAQSSISNQSPEPTQGTSTGARSETIEVEPDINTTPRGKPVIQKKYYTSPVHDRNDFTWQRRYPEATPDTMEIIPGSGVNIRKDALATINASKNYRELTRTLIEAILKIGALQTCSRTGAESPFHEYAGSNIRPRLDDEVQEVIFRFITEFGQQQQWGPLDRKAFNKMIDNILFNSRP